MTRKSLRIDRVIKENGKVTFPYRIIDKDATLYKHPSVLTDDDEYDSNRKNFKPLLLTRKLKNRKNNDKDTKNNIFKTEQTILPIYATAS